ncbi:MAG: hypothetical protein J6Y94_05030, partial [Bacteriovoracaceae bacterium]|nr:hypothetical protein [Bacteriovoracaceae bacterium]
MRRMDQIHRDNFYTNYRDLADYTQFLGLYFDSALAALRPHEVWLDAGAGAAVAIRGYLTAYPQGGKAVGVGVAYPAQNALGEAAAVSPNKKELGEQRFNYVEGYLEDLPPQAFQVFGPHFQLITDVFGPAMYSPLLDRVVRTYAELLAPDGLLMLVLDMHNLRLVDSSQVALPIQDWFLAMEGLEVVE